MGKNVYKSAQGQLIDIDNLRLLNESTIAVGNMKVNARGDQVAPDGTVIKSRNELMKEQYRLNSPVVKTEKSKFGANARRRTEGQLVASVAKEAEVTIKTETETPVQPRNTGGLRGSLAQSVASVPSEPEVNEEVTEDVIDDLQADLDLLKPKSTITRI